MHKLRGYLHLMLSAQLLSSCWLLSNSLFAASVRAESSTQAGSTASSSTSNSSGSSSSSLNLDLSSTTASISGSLLGHDNVVVNFGGTNTTVGSNSLLTPAQYLAALSVINSGQQTLSVNSSGQASGGSFQLPASANLANLLIPSGVTGIQDFAHTQNLNFTGNFNNNGIFYLVSSNQAVNSGVLSALNIVNAQGALLSSVLPSGGIAGFSNLVSGFSFTLNAVNNITNMGTISSAGSLSMLAGNQIINGANNVLANMSALNNLSMIAPAITNQGQISSTLAGLNLQSANLVNSGLLQSMKGDISISNLVQKVLDVNNVSGLISAQDNLSFINTAGRGSSINLTGGVLDARNISFSDRRGSVSVAVDDSSKNISFNSRYVSLDVENGSSGLNLSGLNRAKSVELSYTGAGDIRSGGFKTLGQDLFIDTTGSININGNIVTSPSSSGDAGSVLMNAGGAISVRNITASGRAYGDGGDIILSADGRISGRSFDASGGSAGDPGVIRLESGSSNIIVSNITDNGSQGGGSVSISTPENINVSGTISVLDGTLSLNSGSSNIGNIELGNGQLNLNLNSDSNSPYILDLEQVSELGAGNVSIVGTANIVLSGDCINCLGNLSTLTLNTTGTFTGTGSQLLLSDGQSFTVNAENGIFTGSVVGGSGISFQTNGLLTVDGALLTDTGSINLSGSSFAINSAVDAGSGTVSILPTGSNSTTIVGSQLANITAGQLNLGNGGAAGINILGTADLTGISNHVNLATSGDFSNAGGSIILAPYASMVLSAGNASLGDFSGGSALVVNAGKGIDLSGTINMPSAPVVLNADLSAEGSLMNLQSGSSIVAGSISLNTVHGDLVSGADLNSVQTGLDINSGGSVTILQDSHLSAAQNLSIYSTSDVSINSNVALSAGRIAAGFNPWQAQSISANDLLSSGNVIIDSYRAGSSGGNISLASGVSIIAAGSGNSGNVGLLAGGDISITGSQLAALGGNLWLSAASDVSMDGANLLSLADSSSKAGNHYNGGQIGIMAGAPNTNMTGLLNGLALGRNGTEQIHSDIALNGNALNLQNGSSLSVVQTQDLLISLSANQINLNGGVLFIDPPPTSTVNVSNTSITATGPGISSSPVSIPAGGASGNGANLPPVSSPVAAAVNTGNVLSGTVSIVQTGNLNNAGPNTANVQSSSVNSSDTASRSLGLQSQQLGIYSGQSGVALDTVEESSTAPSLRPAIYCSKPQLLRTSDLMDEDSWIIASSSCQPFTFEEHDGSLIVGSGPAKLAPAADRTILLKEGKILVITVDKIHVVRTPFCNITVPVNTASVVEVDQQGLVRIANLAGGKASVTICRNDETLILAAAPGEQLILAESNVPEKDFSAVAYTEVEHTKVASWNLELSGLRGQKIKFDRQQMAQFEPLLHCSSGCVNQAQMRRLEQLLQSMTSQEPILKSMTDTHKGKRILQSALPLAAKELRPVSYQNTSLHGAISFSTLNAGSAQVKYTGKCRISLASPGLIALEDGEILVLAHDKTVVKSGESHVALKPGTLAIVSKHDGILKVRNIYEKKSTAVVTTVTNKRAIGLQVGQELLVGPRGISLSRALGQDPVGRRRLHSLELASGHSCISSEISLSSLMQNSAILSQLLRSEQDEDREWSLKIMKMAVCITLVTSSHGNYSMLNP